MNPPSEHPLEAVLLLIAGSAPQPWYYQAHARTVGVDPALIADILELLWLEGLIQKAPGDAVHGPGVELTALGRQVLEDPEARDRLRRGEPVVANAAAVVRNSLRRPITPVVTRLLVAANIVVFLWGAYLASQRGNLLGAYLTGAGDLRFLALLQELGAATSELVMKGDWWRLLTTTFLHGGILHVLINMYALNAVGRFVEQTWGGWRLLVIYFVGAWTGSCLAMGYTSGVPCVGASGAICGVLGAEGVWVLLYGRFLPASLARRARSQFVTTLVLLVFISLLPRVSWQAHLGGGIGGACAALLLHAQRFGPPLLRWLALLAVVPLVWGSHAWMVHAWSQTKEGRAAGREQFRTELVEPAERALVKAFIAYRDHVHSLLEDFRPERRPANRLRRALATLDEQLAQLRDLHDRLERTGPFRQPDLEKERLTTLEDLDRVMAAFTEARRCLRAGEEWTPEDERQLRRLLRRLGDTWEQWDQLLKR